MFASVTSTLRLADATLDLNGFTIGTLTRPINNVQLESGTLRNVTEINGVKLANYMEWMKSCYLISATSHPAISVPCGFTADGLPVGVQIVGRHQDDFGVLQLAYAFEQATQLWQRRPPIVAGK